MIIAFEALPAIDLLTYFAIAMNMITPDMIVIPTEEHKRIASKDINVERYNQYKEMMDEIFEEETGGKSRYVHDFMEFWPRTLRYPDGSTSTEILPAIEPSMFLMKHWAQSILKVKAHVLKKVESCFHLPFSCATQLQGAFESHFRLWIKPMSVLYIFHIFFIYFSYIFYILLRYYSHIIDIFFIYY